MIPDPGVSAPTGDPGRVAAAATWHEGLADYFENTASLIGYTVGSLAGTNWDGEAARSYATLGVLVGEHFRAAGATARTASAALRRYANQLERLQHEGVHAVDQTVHWLRQQEKDQKTLTQAQQVVKTAQSVVGQAEVEVIASAVNPGGGRVAAAAHDLSAASDALSRAQTAERAAQKAVDDDRQQVQHWQQRARQIWQEAQNEAAVATGSLEPLAVAPPPLAGAPATFTDAMAADAPFINAHPQMAQQLAQQLAQANQARTHGSGDSEKYAEQQLLQALREGKNIDGVSLAPPHHSSWLGSALKGIAVTGLVGLTEVVGGGPEDPLADGASAGEVELIEGSGAAADAGAAGAADSEAEGIALDLRYKPGWTQAQIDEAEAKVAKIDAAAQKGEVSVTRGYQRAPMSAARRYTSAGGQVPQGYDVDHVIDLQLGGDDTVSNMLPLNSSVNRSLGAQIMHAIKELEDGTPITGAHIGAR